MSGVEEATMEERQTPQTHFFFFKTSWKRDSKSFSAELNSGQSVPLVLFEGGLFFLFFFSYLLLLGTWKKRRERKYFRVVSEAKERIRELHKPLSLSLSLSLSHPSVSE